jgi:hypothetical protein
MDTTNGALAELDDPATHRQKRRRKKEEEICGVSRRHRYARHTHTHTFRFSYVRGSTQEKNNHRNYREREKKHTHRRCGDLERSADEFGNISARTPMTR